MFASPQNPSGVSITRGEIGEMLDAMSRRCPEAILLIDETYREATYGSTAAADTFAGLSERVLTCASLSKAYGAPGLRMAAARSGRVLLCPAQPGHLRAGVRRFTTSWPNGGR